MSACTDTALSPQILAGHACPTRPVSDTASRVVQLWGRMQSQDPSKSKLGQRIAKQLPLGSQGPLHSYTRSMCSREAEAPWLFKPFQDQPLTELLIRALLQRPELADETPDKVEAAVKR